jgi:hypothetical protein
MGIGVWESKSEWGSNINKEYSFNIRCTLDYSCTYQLCLYLSRYENLYDIWIYSYYCTSLNFSTCVNRLSYHLCRLNSQRLLYNPLSFRSWAWVPPLSFHIHRRRYDLCIIHRFLRFKKWVKVRISGLYPIMCVAASQLHNLYFPSKLWLS